MVSKWRGMTCCDIVEESRPVVYVDGWRIVVVAKNDVAEMK